MRWKRQGLDTFRSQNFTQASRVLQLAELFLRPPYPVGKLLKNQWYDCWTHLIISTWRSKFYKKAIQAGKKWRQLEPITSRVRWCSLCIFQYLHQQDLYK